MAPPFPLAGRFGPDIDAGHSAAGLSEHLVPFAGLTCAVPRRLRVKIGDNPAPQFAYIEGTALCCFHFLGAKKMKKPQAITATKWTGQVPPAATAVVKRVEGFFSKPYDDNGALPGGTWTIGYGSIVDKDGHPVTPKTPSITEADAEILLQRDMLGAAQDVRHRVKVGLMESEAAALISWTYNLGGSNLAKSTLLQCLNANQKAKVPMEMRKWIYHEGKPLVGLLRRRWAEAAIFTGRDPVEACVLGWKYIDDLNDWPMI